jgi:hypothetical protein
MKKEKGKIKWATALALTICLCVMPRAFASDVSFTASADKTTIALGEQFNLQFTLSGASSGKNFQLPDLSKFLTLSGPNQSTSMQIINGSVSSSVAYSYVLQARETGKFTIGSATIEAGGKQYSTQPLTITVVKGTAQQKQSAVQSPDNSVHIGDNLFLRAEVDRTHVYQGEQITVTFKVFTRVRITNYTINKLPNMIGFWSEDIAIPQQVNLVNETYKGKQYQVGVLKKTALFPTQPGTLEINPLEIVCQVQVQQRRSNGKEWFDQFFNDPFFNTVQTSNVTITSEPIKITVLPLPKNDAPHNFRGAVGKFSMDVALNKKDVKTNEPLSLKATISGTGNIKILEAPGIEVPNDFEKYDPKITDNIDRTGPVIRGSKTFEWLLVPRYPGEKHIPPLEFSYFDPSQRKYVSLHSGPIDINVEKGSAEPEQFAGTISKEDVKLLNEDIRFIKTEPMAFYRRGEESLSTATVAVMTVLPLLAFFGVVAFRQKSLRDSSDLVSFRARKAMKVATKRLQQAKTLLTANNAEEFYAETSRALWQYVADKLSIDRAELSIDTVTQQLSEKNISAELVGRIKECLELCEFARFAPASASEEEKKKMYDIASEVIVATEKELD